MTYNNEDGPIYSMLSGKAMTCAGPGEAADPMGPNGCGIGRIRQYEGAYAASNPPTLFSCLMAQLNGPNSSWDGVSATVQFLDYEEPPNAYTELLESTYGYYQCCSCQDSY
jgi:hypothetical protein